MLMEKPARAQFIAAGMRLYPLHGYAKLSVRLLAEEAGLSPGMFHHLFASKDEFVGELLYRKYGEGFSQLVVQIPDHAPVREKLRCALLFLAFFTRDNLPWVHRIFAESSNGVACVNTFIRRHGSRHAALLMTLLEEGVASGELPAAAVSQYFCFIMGGVIHPMIIASDLLAARLAPPVIEAEFEKHLISDEAVGQRIDWVLCALFGSAREQETP